METVGSYEAKTHWSAILDKVALGQEIVITKRGKPVARLIPETAENDDEVQKAIKALKLLRQDTSLNDLNWKVLRDEGRQ